MEGFQNKFFQTTFHHHFQAKNDIFGYRFHFEGKNDVGISQVRRVKRQLKLCIELSTKATYDADANGSSVKNLMIK